MLLRATLLVLAGLAMAACSSSNDSGPSDDRISHSAPKSEKPITLTGTLQSGIAAIGGEHTGWVLAADNEAGGMEVDISRVRDQAQANEGKRVTITGRVTQRKYVERGQVPILLAEKIVPAAPPPQR